MADRNAASVWSWILQMTDQNATSDRKRLLTRTRSESPESPRSARRLLAKGVEVHGNRTAIIERRSARKRRIPPTEETGRRLAGLKMSERIAPVIPATAVMPTTAAPISALPASQLREALTSAHPAASTTALTTTESATSPGGAPSEARSAMTAAVAMRVVVVVDAVNELSATNARRNHLPGRRITRTIGEIRLSVSIPTAAGLLRHLVVAAVAQRMPTAVAMAAMSAGILGLRADAPMVIGAENQQHHQAVMIATEAVSGMMPTTRTAAAAHHLHFLRIPRNPKRLPQQIVEPADAVPDAADPERRSGQGPEVPDAAPAAPAAPAANTPPRPGRKEAPAGETGD